uniref:KH domain-containing protein n=1 Tax=Globodera pallida TaxID=36090 RepID=A0A183CE37_GLOPA
MHSNFLNICRLQISSHNTASAHRPFCASSSKVGQMQNPLDMATYRVGAETYRRNCPLETVSTAAPAAGAAFGVAEDEAGTSTCAVDGAVLRHSGDEQTPSPTLSGRSSSSEVQQADFAVSECESPGKKVRLSTATTSSTMTAEIAREIGEVSSSAKTGNTSLFMERKTVEVVSAADGLVYTEKVPDKPLVGSVQYNEAEQYFYDSLRVPTDLVGLLCGKDGIRRNKIAEQNRCTLRFPKKQKPGSQTEIEISSTENALHVQACREALERALADARQKASPTHFISVPIFDVAFRAQFSEMVERICTDETLPEELRNKKMYMTPSKLHLTLSVFKLFTEEEIQRVRHFLDEQFRSKNIRDLLKGTDGKLRIEFPSLQNLSNQPEQCRVLFAQPKSESLQCLANALDDALTQAGLVQKRRSDDVLLHMTVLNTKYLWRGWYTGWHTVDATQLLEKFGQLQFPPVDVEELHLCSMRGNANASDPNGYVSVHSVKFAATDN